MSSGVLLSDVVVYIQCSLVYDSVAGRQHLLSLTTNSLIHVCGAGVTNVMMWSTYPDHD